MSKIRKLLITLLALISTICFTIVGCSDKDVEFVDFENKTIDYDLGSIFDVRDYLEVYDTDGKLYLAQAKVFDSDDQNVPLYLYQFTVEKTSYRIVITVKDGDDVLGTREISVNGINTTPPHIILLDMPEFGVYNNDILVPVKFEGKGATVSKKFIAERYVTNKVNGEYVTTLDTQNAIIKTNNDFTDDGVVFCPTKPGNYKLSIYAWDASKSEAEARVVSKNYAIKETADAWAEFEGFDSPESLASNYHYYNGSQKYEYNALRGIGQLVYVTNADGDYLDENGDILYKKVDESATENRIAYYKKADAQATTYDVLAYYQNLTNYAFYNANDEETFTKEGCVTIKNEDGSDYAFNYKTATIGEEWYQELADVNNVVKYGVIKARASEHSYSPALKRFFLSSLSKNNSFLRRYNDNNSTGWIENPDFDYLSIWVLVKPKNANNNKNTITLYSDSSFYQTTVPVGQWFEYKVSKTEIRGQNYYPYDILSSVTSRPKDTGTYITLSNEDYYDFDFYFDNISYAKGADVVLSSETLLMGQEFTLDIANAGQLTKDDFIFYIGKADSETGVLQTKVNGSSGYAFSVFTANHTLLDGTYNFTPELESGVSSRKYFIQAMLNEQGLSKNNNEQIYASKVITVSNVNVELSDAELGQEVTINASLQGFANVTFEYYVKQTSATEWTTLATNKFTPSVSTSYDVKVVAKVDNAQVELTITKDYTKEIDLKVLHPVGFNKYVINKDISIVATLQGSDNLVVSVKDQNNNPITIERNVLNVANTGIYTITATCTYNGVALSKTQQIEVVGDKDVTYEMFVNGQLFDLNNALTMGDSVTFNVYVNGQLTTQNVSYKVVKLDSKPENNVELDTTSTGFVANYAGTYNVWVYYNDSGVMNASKMATITVEAGYGFFNDFSDSASVYASYKLALTAEEKADVQYKKVTPTDTEINVANSIAPNTSWVSNYNGKYGVISTKPQDVQASNGEYPSTNGALGVALRSFNYGTAQEFNSALNSLMYNSATYAADNAPTLAVKSPNWDYVSIWVYIAKENAEVNETTKLYGIYKHLIGEVKYNEWVEIKLDKFYVAQSYGNRGISEPFTSYNGRSFPTFFLALSTSDAQYEKNKDATVYVDSMAFKKYDTLTINESTYRVESMDEIGLYDSNDNQITGVNRAPYIIEYVKDANTGVYRAVQDTNFTIKAKVNGSWVDSSKLEIMTGAEKLLSVGSVCYKGEDGTTETTLTAYDWYKIDVSLVSNKEGTAISYKDISNSTQAQQMPCIRLRVTYVDSVNNVVYIGYVSECFNSKDVTPRINVELNDAELGQEVIIDASVVGNNSATIEYFVKQTSESEWTALATNKFTPNVPTSYDVKVVVNVGTITLEKVITKDYTKEIALNVQYPNGFDKYVINNDINIEAELVGATDLTIVVKDEDGNVVNVENNVLKVLETGEYTIIASCTYNGVTLTKTQVIEIVGDKEITAEIYVKGQLFDVNNTITMGETVTINALVDGQLTTDGVTYKIVKLDSKPENNIEINANGAGFVANYVGTYNVWVYYTESGVTNASQMITLNVVAHASYLNDYSDSESVWSAYKLALTSDNKVDYQYKGMTDNGGNAPDTYWYSEYNGKYGVISTKPQQVELESTGGYPSVGGALGVGLRSFNYKTSNDWKASAELNEIVYNGAEAAANNVPTLAIRSPNWDYLSIWIYLDKKDAQPTDKTIIYGVYDVKIDAEVPYNTWYELKVDKFYVARSYGNRGIKEPFCTYKGSFPTFFLAQSRNDAQYEANKDVVVYVDSMSFAKYSTIGEYTVKRFDSVALYDAENNVVTGTNVAPYVIDYTKDAETGVYTQVKPLTLTIKATANGQPVDSDKIVIDRGVRTNIGYATYYKATADGDVSTTMGGTLKAYDWYKVDLTLKTNAQGTAITNVNTATDAGAKTVATYQLCIKYVDEANKVIYIGYIAECFNGNEVANA